MIRNKVPHRLVEETAEEASTSGPENMNENGDGWYRC